MIHALTIRWLAGAGLILITVCVLTVLASLTIGGITHPKIPESKSSRDQKSNAS